MQDMIPETSAQATHDFAGLLAALTASKPAELLTWNEEALQPDVATLSYERALRTHARYKAALEVDTNQLRDPQALQPGVITQREMRACPRADAPMTQSSQASQLDERKCTSVTIRMSKAECEQLHTRAAEAGLTISAYLRSCTFEVEALRAEVKEALAELRSAPASNSKPSTQANSQTSAKNEVKLERRTRFGWLRKVMPDLHPARNLVRA